MALVVKDGVITPDDPAQKAIIEVIDSQVMAEGNDRGVDIILRTETVIALCAGRGLSKDATKNALAQLYQMEYIELLIFTLALGSKMRNRYRSV